MIHFHGRQLCQNCFASLLIRGLSKRKDLLPLCLSGSIVVFFFVVFFLEKTPFQKGLGVQNSQTGKLSPL